MSAQRFNGAGSPWPAAAAPADDSFVTSRLGEEEWAEYEMPLETIDDAPWGLAVQHGEDDSYAFMAEVIADWHASGLILELETEYGVENTPFALRMHEEFKDN